VLAGASSQILRVRFVGFERLSVRREAGFRAALIAWPANAALDSATAGTSNAAAMRDFLNIAMLRFGSAVVRFYNYSFGAGGKLVTNK
jgi:hypothetical protein